MKGTTISGAARAVVCGGALLLAPALLAQSDLRLIDALEQRDLKKAAALLNQHVDVNVQRADGVTALHWAVYWDEIELASRLLKSGAHTNIANELGVTPLALASANGDGALVELLLQSGASSSVTEGVPPLLSAARAGSVQAVTSLLKHGADVNAVEPAAGQTALMWAIAEQHPDVVHVLLEHHADVHARTRVTKLRINRGGPIGSSERPVPEDINKGGSTPLLFAARVGSIESARLLVDAGANVNDTTADGTSALLLATHSGHGRLAEFLLERGADPNRADAGYAPLHAAVLIGDLRLVTALLAHKADPNVQQAKGNPVRRTGEDLVLPNSLVGATPYYLAARFGEVEMMERLVAAGADPKIRAADGTSPLMTAAGVGWALPNNRRGVDMTSKKSAWLGQEAEEAISLKAVQAALRLDKDVNAQNSVGETALFGAVPKGFGQIIKLLVEHGAKIDAKNRRGQTLLSLTRVRLVATAATPPDVLIATEKLLRTLGATE